MISRAAAPTSSSLSHLSARSLRAQGTAARSFATVQEAPPVRHYGGLQDQDRIFTNLYGHHGADLKSAMKYGGDWHRTKDIVLKGHDWVGYMCFGSTGPRELALLMLFLTAHFGDQGFWPSWPWWCWFPLGIEIRKWDLAVRRAWCSIFGLTRHAI